MDNIGKIKKVSAFIKGASTLLMAALVLGDIAFWVFINSINQQLVTVNSKPVPLASGELSWQLMLVGFIVSLLPLCALLYGLISLRRLFSDYSRGEIFAPGHLLLFRKMAKSIVFCVFFSVIYESAKSVLFSLGNPPGQRVLEVGFSSDKVFILLFCGIIWVIAWIMDEGYRLSEENRLTV
jgi:hypothetical protein